MFRSFAQKFGSGVPNFIFTLKKELRIKAQQTDKSLVVSNKKNNKSNENKISIMNISRGNKLKTIRLPKNFEDMEEKKLIFKGKSLHLSNELNNEDPEELVKYNEDLDLYAMNENLYHKKILDEDIKNQKKVKLAIVRKKINKLENLEEKNFNLLTWDAKEQIKHLHMNDPSKLKTKPLSFF